MRFDEEKARRIALRYCSHYTPRTPSAIAARLKKGVDGFYPKTPAGKLKKKVDALLRPLVSSNLLVVYRPKDKVWKRAREMATKGARLAGDPVPRNATELYQTNFLYLSADTTLPVISLPRPKHELNFELCALLFKFKKPKNYTWEMLNLLICASNKKQRDDLRIHLYVLPFDYNEIELLEDVLEFGVDFKGMDLPFRPNIDEAKGFLGKLAVGK